jgi:hypothetical protein
MPFIVPRGCGYIPRRAVVLWRHTFGGMPGSACVLRIGGMGVVPKNCYALARMVRINGDCRLGERTGRSE